MPRFTYTARDAAGQSVRAALDAVTRKEALRLLAARGLQPVRVAEETSTATRKTGQDQPQTGSNLRINFSRVRLSRIHRLPFLEALHDLTTSGLSAGEAIRLLSQRIKDPSLKRVCTMLWERISEGAPLSRAMAAIPEVFDDSTLNLIAAGETTGSLNDTLARIIEHLTEQREVRRQVLAALAYPVFMMVMASGVILFFLFFLLPRLQTLLYSLGGELPTSTALLVAVSSFALDYGLIIGAGLVFAALSFWRWRASPAGRAMTDAWMLHLPLLGPLSVGQTVLAFSQTLSVLLENGITAVEALRMTERQIQNRVHQRAFHEATDRVIEGESLSLALQRTGCFPDLVLDQLSVGENTGNVVPSLKKIALSYRKQLSLHLNTFTRVLASVVLLSVFAFVGFIALAIVSGVFQLSSSIQVQ